MNSLDSGSIKENIQSILAAVEQYRSQDRSASGMVFTDNWYDSHPRLLIFDPVLNAYDKLVWLAIRTYCRPDLSLTAFPSYDQIQKSLNISRGTVSCSITKLRITRWITLLCRQTIRNSSGKFVRDGNVYMVHGEPLDLKSTIELDANYMNYLQECCQHRNSGVKKISTLIVTSLQNDIDDGEDILNYKHPFQRRTESWSSLNSDTKTNHVEQNTKVQKSEEQTKSSSVVHEKNYGKSKPQSVVQNDNRGSQHHYSVSSSKNNYYYNTKVSEAVKTNSNSYIFPKSLTSNQQHLILLHLQRLPKDLPSPPSPWQSWDQLLLDELDGRIKIGEAGKCNPVWNPVSLMSAYCQRLANSGFGLKEDGQFQIEFAENTFRSRKKRWARKQAHQKTQENYRKATLKRLSQYKSSS